MGGRDELKDLAELESKSGLASGTAQGQGQLRELYALEVADLGGERLEAGGRQRDRLQEFGVAVAGDDLGRNRLAIQAQFGKHAFFDLWEVAVSTRPS